jgi:outer membrane protein assembly factor BamB
LRTARRLAIAVLVVVCSGCWTQFRGGPAHTGSQLFETTIDRSNVAELVTAWRGHMGTPASEAVVANGMVYVGALDHTLYAFDASGCPGSPDRCTARWTATLVASAESTPAVSDGVVYITSGEGTDSQGRLIDGYLYAFDAAGQTNCSGSPRVCAPVWTASLPGLWVAAPTVADGVVFVTTKDGYLAAFDARDSSGCSGAPRLCSPLWTGRAGAGVWSSPTVANGTVFVGSLSNRLYAFDAAGQSGCAGVPRVCQPTWTGATSDHVYITPVVADGLVFAAAQDGHLVGFDAAGTRNCAGTPRDCTPLWTATMEPLVSSTPAVADGTLYVASYNFVGGYHGTLYAYDTTGTRHCSGNSLVCTPLWTAALAQPVSASPTVANGVVYLSDGGGFLDAFDARGTTNCDGTPKTCTALWSTPLSVSSTATVAGGSVYVGSTDGHLYSLRLPA